MLTGVVVGSTLALASLLSAPALLPAGPPAAGTTAVTAVIPAGADAAAAADTGTAADTARAATPADAPPATTPADAPAAAASAAAVPAVAPPRPGSVGPVSPGSPAADALAALARVAAPEPAVAPVAAGSPDVDAPADAAAPSGENPPAAPAPSGPEAEVVALTNDRRADAGCGDLRVDPRITEAAQRHSEDMAGAGYFAHDSRDGRSFADRVSAAGYPSPGAENIAQGQPDAASVVQAWMDSPGHRKNIEDCTLTTIGIGLAGDYWTQDFGR